MDNNKLKTCLDILKSASPDAIVSGDGFVSVIRIPVNIDASSVGILKEFFHTGCLDDGSFVCYIVDNKGIPIIHLDLDDALMNAFSYFSGMEKKYIFESYRIYGIKLEIPKEVTITFLKRSGK